MITKLVVTIINGNAFISTGEVLKHSIILELTEEQSKKLQNNTSCDGDISLITPIIEKEG